MMLGLVRMLSVTNLALLTASLTARQSSAQSSQPIMKINFGVNQESGGYEPASDANHFGNVNKYHGGSGVVGNTDADAAYRSHIWSGSYAGYTVKQLVPNKLYDFTLGFAESYTPNCGIGKRVFSAQVGDETKHNIDVYLEAGCQVAYKIPFLNIQADSFGDIEVSITKGPSDFPFLSVLEVYESPPSLPPSPTPPPSTVSPTSTMAPSPFFSEWKIVDTMGTIPSARVEACFVTVDKLAYLIGGRGIKPVDVYDPYSQSWSKKTGPGIELHHMQCVPVGEKIYIVSSWTGDYPTEVNVPSIYIYDTLSDSWSTKEGLPEGRRRGGGAAVLYNDEIFVSHGNRGGHGSHAVAVGWLDKYNVATDTWITNLADAPNPRDHTGGAVVNDMLCVAGGRDSGVNDFFDAVVVETDCYDFSTGQWEVKASIPQGRAASGYGLTCDGNLMLAGGEGFGRAWPNVDVFDGTVWSSAGEMTESRHGTGLAFSCECNQVHIASGSIVQAEYLTTATETFFPLGVNQACSTPQPSLSPSLPPTPLPTPLPTESFDDGSGWGDDGGSWGFVFEPTAAPSGSPSLVPSAVPTKIPTIEPTPHPTLNPTPQPTPEPTATPTPEPTLAPTQEPTKEPTVAPSPSPTPEPSSDPTAEPTPEQTDFLPPVNDSGGFVIAPTVSPSKLPSESPSHDPSEIPSAGPTESSSLSPSQSSDPTPVVTVQRINFGRNEMTDGYDPSVSVDFTGSYQNFGGGGVPIDETQSSLAFASHVWFSGAELVYTLRLVPDNTYDVHLGWAESYGPNCKLGARVFSASVGDETLSGIDVYSQVGCRKPYSRIFYNVRADGNGDLKVVLSKGRIENPFLALLEVTTPSGDIPTGDSDAVLEVKTNFGRYGATGSYTAPVLSQFSGQYNLFGGDGILIDGTDEELAYASHIWFSQPELTYTLQLDPDETYDVQLGWAESYEPNCLSGARVFSVAVNGNLVENIDVFQRSGACRKPYQMSFYSMKSDAQGRILVTLRKGPAENAFLSLVEAKRSDTENPDDSGGFVLPTQQPSLATDDAILKLQFGRNQWVGDYRPATASNFGNGVHKAFSGSGVAIGNTDDDLAYAGHVWTPEQSITYSLDLDFNEEYTIVLGFAESFVPNCVEGARIFSVAVGGYTATDIDVFAEAGCNNAYDITFDNVPGGMSNITLIQGSVENPFLATVEVYLAALGTQSNDNTRQSSSRQPRTPAMRPGTASRERPGQDIISSHRQET